MNLQVGQIVTGRVTGLRSYGAFVQLDSSTVQGLIHISEFTNGYVSRIDKLVHLNQLVRVQILNIDPYNGAISLSLRSLKTPPLKKQVNAHKHYWANHPEHLGYQSIARIKPVWIQEALRDLK
ncbi:S1 RNA-binding domain-containing protein [Lactobacillus sp. DCY120]|uniref:S1 RNA-binding domain-containing protein n=1 Tax=Bombilactobacillus apium TaxID=2675299 RepID=A0A850R8Y0_9LACO|nr:CvfD/Ygs/GSP13 family RNA-binding post-transcriptional regulator [Bombilactobacillus apium]NVY97192.1 S1 RNA-binding domain-containing protein [Bombilactobacillus apium]